MVCLQFCVVYTVHGDTGDVVYGAEVWIASSITQHHPQRASTQKDTEAWVCSCCLFSYPSRSLQRVYSDVHSAQINGFTREVFAVKTTISA